MNQRAVRCVTVGGVDEWFKPIERSLAAVGRRLRQNPSDPGVHQRYDDLTRRLARLRAEAAGVPTMNPGFPVETFETYTAEYLRAQPTLAIGHDADLKVATENTRWWVSRMTREDGEEYEIHVELLTPQGWRTVHKYEPLP